MFGYLDRFLLPIGRVPDLATAYPGEYDDDLVALSLLIAILAAYAALDLSGRVAAASTRAGRLNWIGAGAASLGLGIWAMHFIGMLAFTLPCGLTYDPWLTLLSILPAVAGSAVALHLIGRSKVVARRKLVLGAILMGGGIGAMHYAGMAAVRLPAELTYDAAKVAVSVLVAVVMAFLALSLRCIPELRTLFGRYSTLASAAIMGTAIAGMHYTAMGAAIFIPTEQSPAALTAVDPGVLSMLLALFAVFVVASALAAGFAGRQFETMRQLTREIASHLQAEEAASRDHEGRMHAIVDAVMDGIVTIDAAGIVETFNPAAGRIFGYASAEVVGNNVSMLMPEPFHSGHDNYLRNYLTTGTAKIIGIGREVLGQRKDGSTFPMELTVSEMQVAGRRMFTGIIRDVTERKFAEEKVRSANERMAMIAVLEKRDREMTLQARMNDLLLACKSRDEAIQIFDINLKDLFSGLSGALALQTADGDGLKTVVRWGDTMVFRDNFGLDDCWAVRRGRLHDIAESSGGLVCEHIEAHTPSGYICLPLMVQNTLLGVLSVETMTADVESHMADHRLAVSVGETIKLSLSNLALRDALSEQATRDPLTKLFNRRFMNDSLAHLVARALRSGLPLSIAVLDLDFFKRVNDTFGHDAGDTVLREFGQFLQDNLRSSDIPCRTGGEEFVLIMPDTPLAGARKHCDILRERWKAVPIQHDGKALGTITTSIGLATLPEHGRQIESVLKAADVALYAAKQGGRDRVSAADAAASP